MKILAITQQLGLLERLRTAFEGAGHGVEHVPDCLQALVSEAWVQAHLLLVDATGDPMDGFRLCHLLRAESSVLFRNLPIFIIIDHPPEEAERARLRAVDGDGFIRADASIQNLLRTLGPLLQGAPLRTETSGPLLVCGLTRQDREQVGEVIKYFGLTLHSCARSRLRQTLATLRPPIFFLGVGPSSRGMLEILRELPERPSPPYPILVGTVTEAAEQRKLLIAGAMDWLPLPLSAPLILHACRRALEWLHGRRIQRECQTQIQDLVRRKGLLELEAGALRNEVITDALTGLLNRRAFDQHLEHASNQWERNQRPFVLVLGDMDYFKLINDRFGHRVGDQVLQAVAQAMRAGLRRSDLAFRIGGEEFAILLSDTSLAAGTEVAEKIRRRIDEHPVVLASGQTVLPSLSFGVGGPDRAGTEDLFVHVDQALYQAKRKGRNRVEVAALKG